MTDKPDIIPSPATHKALLAFRHLPLIAAGVFATVLAAKVQIPFWPVPMTLQMITVMGFAVWLGPRKAAAIFAGYLALGAAGLPVFAGTPERGIGLAYMVGPTGGYLAGFLIATFVTGHLATGRGTLGKIGAMLAGLGVIYAAGAAWLAFFVPARDIVALGVLPFIPGDLVKIGLVAIGTKVGANILRGLR